MSIRRWFDLQARSMIARGACGFAGFLLLATLPGIDGRSACAEPRSEPKSLEDVPLQVPSKLSPWPGSPDQSQPQEASDPQTQQAADPPIADNPAAPTSEDVDVVDLDIDWSLLDVDAST